jgi:nitrate reductase gamma subunit
MAHSPDPLERDPNAGSRPKGGGILALAKIMFFGLLMIGKKSTWEKGGVGANVTLGQMVAGAIIGGIVVVGLLVLLARFAIRAAAGQ